MKKRNKKERDMMLLGMVGRKFIIDVWESIVRGRDTCESPEKLSPD